MKYAAYLVVSALALVAGIGRVTPVEAQGIPPYEVVADGTKYEIQLSARHKDVKELSVYFLSKGNVSTAVEIRSTAPLGTKISARGGLLRGGDAAANLVSSKLIQPFKIRTEKKKELTEVGLTPLDEFPTYGEVYVWYHLQKDACSGGKGTQYVTQVTVNLAGIDPAEYDRGFGVSISLKEFKYPGDKVASIKPASDGMYKNEPILLMQTISYEGEYVNIVQWANGKIKTRKRIPVVKYVGYKGYSLSLARLLGSLFGGKATFELSNGGDIYGVCFKAVRTRQSVNGYPAP